MFAEEDLLPLSALQHLLFCERQVALIHVERVWLENGLTMQGRQLHKRVEGKTRQTETRGNLRITRSLDIRSFELGLVGKADVVEFHRDERGTAEIVGSHHRWHVTPVEYKRGKPKRNPCDRVQLCAQALCLEEMLGARVDAGAIFYGRTKRRLDVAFDGELRQLTRSAAARLHELVNTGTTPLPEPSPKCRRCSLIEICVPEVSRPSATSAYVRRYIWGGAP